jgi:hypothetical protein
MHSPGGAPATVLAFTCNHCPYALAWHERLIMVAADYAGRGVKVLAINSNDPVKYPADSLEASVKRARDGEFGAVPYLHDDTQDVARQFGAAFTPDIFVLNEDLNVRYHGAPDSDYGDPSQNASYVRDALDALLAGADPDPSETEPIGCTIKWRG